MTDKEAAERFWAYALSVYGRTEAREAFLRLQDRDGADVPMLLWCLWCGSQRHGIPDDVMVEAITFSTAWRVHVVEPLRTARRALKPGVEAVPIAVSEEARALIAPTEQALERIQMTHLAHLPSAATPKDGAALIAKYAKMAYLALDHADVSVIIEAA